MGAYYTQEDITEYISKSTIIPFLFDAARTRCKVAFENPNGPTVWDLLRADPDRYIYSPVRHGTERPLPPEIAAGLLDTQNPDLIERRKPWNKPAAPEHALATETWREVVARRQHHWRVWSAMAGREAAPNWIATPPNKEELAGFTHASPVTHHSSPRIQDINALVTLNLDLRQFAQDVIETSEGPDLLMAFWQAIASITVLDPTGGSGAFIFAALNVLEPLYEACLDRMEAFLAEWGGHGKKLHPNYHKKFTDVLERVAQHPNRRYFILKSIIVNNLYAVDIMEEAVEICKVRLFLALAAQVDPDPTKDNLGIEPLPDIDFNIRCGNTLVGYATAEEVRHSMKAEKTSGADQMRLGVAGERDAYAEFEDEMLKVDAAFRSFRKQQTELGGAVTADDKHELQKRLAALEGKLNSYLARDYRIKTPDKDAYAQWLRTHQPFHWLIEFYGIIANGGFDIVIGNPPYVEITKVSNQYRLRNFVTEPCGNLYAPCTERSFTILHQRSHFGFIVQQPITSTIRMAPARQLILQRSSSAWSATFDDRPSKLFDGMHHARLAIILAECSGDASAQPHLSVTPYNKWFKDERTTLFQRLHYIPVSRDVMPGLYPKISTETELGVLRKLAVQTGKLGKWLSTAGNRHKLFYKITGVGSWFTITPRPPRFLRDGQESSSTRESEMLFGSAGARDRAFCILNSSLFYWFYQVRTNCRDFNPSDFKTFPVPRSMDAEDMSGLAKTLWHSLESSAGTVAASHSLTGDIQYEQFRPRVAKPIIDQVDTALARHYGFAPEELDFILNYDSKYRVGRETENDEE